MLLHAVADPPALFERWQNMLLPEGFVMFSCLGPGSLRGLVDVYARRSWPAPTINFVDMHDLGDMLVHAGFADPVMDQETLTIHWDSAEALCADLRRLGGNVSPLRFAGLRTHRWMEAMSGDLERLRNARGKLSLDFEIVYGHAFKATLSRPLKGETRISIEDVRRSMPSAKGTA
jgi:malonyl-CoA O-methyltransferase